MSESRQGMIQTRLRIADFGMGKGRYQKAEIKGQSGPQGMN